MQPDTKPKVLEITPEDLAKVYRARNRSEKSKVNSSWLLMAEFGYYFGWQGIQSIRNNEITLDEAEMLIIGARKIWRGQVYDHSSAVLIGSSSASSKKPGQTFKKLTRELIKYTKADV
jgi:hypothetical protein